MASADPDMWGALAEKEGLFSPHQNNCDSTEIYVSLGGGTAGFCMEKDQRSSTGYTAAKEECASLGKRMAEPEEFIYACNNPPTGLINMTNDEEWAGNKVIFTYMSSSLHGLIAPVMGYGSCAHGSWGVVARSDNYSNTAPYRCVH
jgi:hypothetical protein